MTEQDFSNEFAQTVVVAGLAGGAGSLDAFLADLWACHDPGFQSEERPLPLAHNVDECQDLIRGDRLPRRARDFVEPMFDMASW